MDKYTEDDARAILNGNHPDFTGPVESWIDELDTFHIFERRDGSMWLIEIHGSLISGPPYQVKCVTTIRSEWKAV